MRRLPIAITSIICVVVASVCASSVFAQQLTQTSKIQSVSTPTKSTTELSADVNLASESLVMTAIPPRTEVLEIKPGETIQTQVQLKNVSGKTQTVGSQVKDFIIDQDGRTPIPVTATEAAPLRWSLASWVSISPSTKTLAPNEMGQFNVVIHAPTDALPGGHYAMILHTPMSELAKSKEGKKLQSASSVNPQVGTLVYVKVPGNIHEEAFIRSFRAPSWVEFGPVPLSYVVENLSDIHISPQASIEIKNVFGMTKEKIAIEPLNIFPFSTRQFSAQFENTWGFGPYTAHLTVPYGNSGKLVTSSIVFWMFPYRIVMAILVLFFTILALYIVIKRHIDHRNDVKTHHIEVLEERIRELEQKMRQE